MFLQYCTAVSKELPGDLVALLKWTMEKVNSYFHGISNRRWIPRPEAQVLVQDCHDMVEPWLNLWEASRFHVFRNCCPGHEFAVRKGFLASLTGVLVVVGLCLPRPRSCTCNKRLGFLVAYFPAFFLGGDCLLKALDGWSTWTWSTNGDESYVLLGAKIALQFMGSSKAVCGHWSMFFLPRLQHMDWRGLHWPCFCPR